MKLTDYKSSSSRVSTESHLASATLALWRFLEQPRTVSALNLHYKNAIKSRAEQAQGTDSIYKATDLYYCLCICSQPCQFLTT